MPTKIRLQRYGKKGQPFYHIVIADGRAPRDGKFIEKIGSYNPLTQPATINLDVDQAVSWLRKGAQPTDTVRAIMTYKGAMYKNHLLIGVDKGAFSLEDANAKFQVWADEKAAKINNAKSSIEESKRNAKKDSIAAEVKVKEQRAEEIAKRKAAEIEAKVAAARAIEAAKIAKETPAPAHTEEAETTEVEADNTAE